MNLTILDTIKSNDSTVFDGTDFGSDSILDKEPDLSMGDELIHLFEDVRVPHTPHLYESCSVSSEFDELSF